MKAWRKAARAVNAAKSEELGKRETNWGRSAKVQSILMAPQPSDTMKKLLVRAATLGNYNLTFSKAEAAHLQAEYEKSLEVQQSEGVVTE